MTKACSLLLILLFFACGPQKNKTASVHETDPHKFVRIDSLDITSMLEKKLPVWVSYCRKTMPDFKINAFTKSISNSFTPELENPGDSGLVDPDKMKYCYIPSPDGKYLLDIYSYRYLMNKDKDGKYHISGGDPESTIEITDTKSHVWKRIVMAGPQEGYDDACWLTNSVFLVVGLSGCSEKSIIPCFHLYDLAEGKVVVGKWPVCFVSSPDFYLQKWKGKNWNVKWD